MFDALIVGGGFAGLSAATYLARGRSSVCVLDTGAPRNRFADASHGFLGRDGSNPHDILAAGREQLFAYDKTLVIERAAARAERTEDGFAVHLADGETITARKLILAFGLRDALPDIPGLQPRWGRSVLHCPYCHGYEFRDRPLGVLYRVPMSAHQAMLITQWGPTTLYMNGETLDPDTEAQLTARGVAIEPAKVLGLEGEGSGLHTILLDGGRTQALTALYVAPRSTLSSPLAAQLGCTIEDGPMGEMIVTDEFKQTNIPGVYAAGDIARAPHSISWAVADGVLAGVAVHRDLVFG